MRKNRRVELSGDNSLEVCATVDVFTGKPLVALYQDANEVEVSMTPVEADRLAAALKNKACEAREKMRRARERARPYRFKVRR
jgi:hypothetical protein